MILCILTYILPYSTAQCLLCCLPHSYGHLKVTVSKIPYSSLYGVKNDTTIMTLQKFVSLFPSFQDSNTRLVLDFHGDNYIS